VSRGAPLLLLLGLAAAGCSNAPGPPQDHYRRALAALAADDPRTARIELLNAIKAAPNAPALRLAQARTYLMLGEGAAAEEELKRANALGIPRSETGHLMADALLLQHGKAEAALDAATSAGPAHQAEASRMLGRAYQALGRIAEAGAAFDRALARSPDDARLWADIGRFRRFAGDSAGAIEAADKAVGLDPKNPDALTLRGELTRAQYGLAASLPWFDRALELDPEHVPALLERAATLGDLGRTRAMLADSRRALALRPNEPTAWYLQAVLAARGRAFDLARRLYERAAPTYDERPAGMLLGGLVELQAGSPAQAARRLRRLVALQPANLRARRLLGAALWKLDDVKGVIEVLQPVADRADADAYALTLVGKAHARLGDPEAAGRYLARASLPPASAGTVLSGPVSDSDLLALRREAEARPGDAPAQVHLIRALLARGQGDEALDRARRLQAANPGSPDAHLLVGDAWAIQARHAEAAAAYRNAANLAFTEPVALRLIEALRNSGDAAGAARVLALFLGQNPQNVAALLLAANAHLEARRWEEAIALYEQVRRRTGSTDAVLLNNLAWAYSEVGEIHRALPLARRAWQLDPNNPATADTLGWLLYRSGDRVAGLGLLERAARGAPTDSEIAAHLAAARRG
jgi:cellulose synthase operon protein C